MVFPRQRQSRMTAARLSIQSLSRWWSTRRCWSPRTLRHMLSIWLSQMVVLGMLPQCDRWPKAFLISGLVRTGNLTTLDQPWKKSGTSIQMYIYIYTSHSSGSMWWYYTVLCERDSFILWGCLQWGLPLRCPTTHMKVGTLWKTVILYTCPFW